MKAASRRWARPTAARAPCTAATSRRNAKLSMNVLLAQRRELVRLHDAGAVSHAVLQEIEVDLDLAEMALSKLDWRGAET